MAAAAETALSNFVGGKQVPALDGRTSAVVDPSLRLELIASKPTANLHETPYPIENSSECQAGNETYGPGQVIGNCLANIVIL